MGLVARLRGEDAGAAGATLHHAAWLLDAACQGLLPAGCAGVAWRAALAGAARPALAALADLGAAGAAGERVLGVLCRALAWSRGGDGGGGGSFDGGKLGDEAAAAEAVWLGMMLDVLRVLPGLAVRLAPALPLLPAGPAGAAPLAACWRAVLAAMAAPDCAGDAAVCFWLWVQLYCCLTCFWPSQPSDNRLLGLSIPVYPLTQASCSTR
jgi:hypothetical protein